MDKYLEAMSTDDRFTEAEKKAIALEEFLKETGYFDPQEPIPDAEALRQKYLMAKSAFRGEGQQLGDDDESDDDGWEQIYNHIPQYWDDDLKIYGSLYETYGGGPSGGYIWVAESTICPRHPDHLVKSNGGSDRRRKTRC